METTVEPCARGGTLETYAKQLTEIEPFLKVGGQGPWAGGPWAAGPWAAGPWAGGSWAWGVMGGTAACKSHCLSPDASSAANRSLD